MMTEIKLTKNVIELLEDYRKMRIEFFELESKDADAPKIESYYRFRLETYKTVGYEYLAEEFLRYQAHFADKKSQLTLECQSAAELII